jgi:hypothetical protein
MIRHRSAAFFLPATLALALAAGCHSSNNNSPDAGSPDAGNPTPDGGVLGSGDLTGSTSASNGAAFSLPLDAVPSSDGSSIFFTGVDPGTSPAIFKTAVAAGSTATVVTTGGVLGAPLGLAISSDGSTLYVADPAGTTSSGKDRGVIFTVAASGGSPAELTPTLDYAPRSVAVAKVGTADEVVFIGTDKSTGVDGVFEVSGAAVTSVVSGKNPSAVAVGTDGTIYILDQAGSIAKVAKGSTTATALGGASQTLSVSFPSGMDLAQDQSALLVSGFDPANGKESISRVEIASGAVTQLLESSLSGKEPSGLHRAPNADVYAFVDVGAGSSGTIYLLK